MKIATWNVNSLRVRLNDVCAWMDAQGPDVLALQETKVEDAHFPVAAFSDRGYQAVYSGQKTYNGVALLSRHPATDARLELAAWDPQKRYVAVTIGGVRMVNVYVPNGAQVDSDKYVYKLRWLEALRTALQEELRQYPELLLMGDFNIAPEDEDVHDPAAWMGSVLVSPQERACFRGLLGLGLADVFRAFPQEAGTFSWWDYRVGAFRRNHGLRIDHILASRPLAERCRGCAVDRGPRAGDRPSDHAPVVAEFA